MKENAEEHSKDFVGDDSLPDALGDRLDDTMSNGEFDAKRVG